MTTYTLGHHESVLRSHTWRTVANSAAYLRPHLVPGARVLDVGCGPGTITAEMASLVGPTGSVVGVDLSSEVVHLARTEHLDVAKKTPTNLRFEVGDITALPTPIAEGGFDIVHAHQVLQHVEDPVTVLRTMEQVTRPGGIVAVRDADYAAMTWYPELEPLEAWLTLYHRVARHNGAEPDAGRRLLAWATEAGFTSITTTASVWCFSTPEDRGWWGGLQADRIRSSDVAAQAVEAGFATSADLEMMSKGWREWAAHPHAWFAVLHGEILCRVPGREQP